MSDEERLELDEAEGFEGFGTGRPEDYRQAQWLAGKFGGKWRYDHTNRVWHHWNGFRWAPDKTNSISYAVAKAAAMAIPKERSEEVRKSLTKLLTVAGVDRALEALAAMPEYATDGSDWDQIPYLLGCRNGIVDLRVNALVVYPGPELLVTKTTGHDFIPIAHPSEFIERAPLFMDFMADVMSGDPDMITFLLEWFGASIFGFSPEQRFLLMIGIGRNGKGALKHSIMKATGEYGAQPDANVYMRSRFGAVSSSNARADLMDLKGKRIGFFSEPEGGRFNEAMLKAHTGGDVITARGLYQKQPISWEPTHSITFLVNDAPEVEDLGPSMGARVMVADFQERYDGAREDKQLYTKLEQEADGILAILCWFASYWYQSWSTGRGGIEPPARVVEQSRRFMERNDPLVRALEEYFETGPGLLGSASLCYEQFCQWHYQSGEEGEPMSKNRFAAALEKKGFRKVKKPSGLFYVNLKPKSAVEIADETEDDDE